MAERCSEKYLKRLIGRNEIEDALKQLDRLTQEKARMATAEDLRMTHTTGAVVKSVMERVLAVDAKVLAIDDRVAGVDDVDDNVAGVDDDKVAVVINGV